MKKQHKKYCFALDLINDEALIQAYIEHHKEVWPEIIHQIKDTGVRAMEIYRVSDRLFMIIETNLASTDRVMFSYIVSMETI